MDKPRISSVCHIHILKLQQKQTHIANKFFSYNFSRYLSTQRNRVAYSAYLCIIEYHWSLKVVVHHIPGIIIQRLVIVHNNLVPVQLLSTCYPRGTLEDIMVSIITNYPQTCYPPIRVNFGTDQSIVEDELAINFSCDGKMVRLQMCKKVVLKSINNP